MSRCAWIIDEDHLYGGRVEHNAKARVKVTGPSDASAKNLDLLTHSVTVGYRFRMKDDDGNLVHSGRFIGDVESEDAFGPLDDFGMPDSGCTVIEYYVPYEGGSHWVAI